MRIYLVFAAIFGLSLLSTQAMADILYESWDDDGYSSGHYTRYSSGYGYDDDDRGYSSSYYDDGYYDPPPRKKHGKSYSGSYSGRMPEQVSGHGEKVIIVNPAAHAWAAYDADGKLVRSGLAASGSNYCRDLHRRCHTPTGTFRIYSMGGPGCISHKFPIGRGGAKMPYCMYFHGGQAIHGSYEMADANVSHGCVRIDPSAAEWLRYNFADIGTKVVIKSY